MERGKLPEIPVPAWPQTATARLTNHPLSNREFLEVPYIVGGAHARELQRRHHRQHLMTLHDRPPSGDRSADSRPPAGGEACRPSGVGMVAGGAGWHRRARMLSTTSALEAPQSRASAHSPHCLLPFQTITRRLRNPRAHPRCLPLTREPQPPSSRTSPRFADLP